MALILIFVAVICVLALFLLLSDPAEREIGKGNAAISKSRWKRLREHKDKNKKTPVVSKAVILAMAQRRIYSLSDAPNNQADEAHWAHQLMIKSSAKLDAYGPIVHQLDVIVDLFCNRIDKILDRNQKKLCVFYNELALISEARNAIEEEVYRSPKCAKKAERKAKDKDECRRKLRAPCPTGLERKDADELALAVLAKFVEDVAKRELASSDADMVAFKPPLMPAKTSRKSQEGRK